LLQAQIVMKIVDPQVAIVSRYRALHLQSWWHLTVWKEVKYSKHLYRYSNKKYF
jgi:hypothetical protein